MARQIKGDRELSWHKATKRWCKVIRGKRVYFGKGKCKTDKKSYKAALEKYREHIDRLAIQESAEEERRKFLAFFTSDGPRNMEAANFLDSAVQNEALLALVGGGRQAVDLGKLCWFATGRMRHDDFAS